MATRQTWTVSDGPSQWRATIAFWESLPGDKKVVNFSLIRPGRGQVATLQMEILVMGRGPSLFEGVSFQGPSQFWESGASGVSGPGITLKKARVTNYSFDSRTGEANFTL